MGISDQARKILLIRSKKLNKLSNVDNNLSELK